MRLLVRGDPNALRASFSFSTSGMIHGALLALVVFGKTAPAPEPRQSLYDEAIRPHEKEIVWYHVPDRLPDVRPADAPKAGRRPLRATRKSEQRIVAGPRDDAHPPRLVWAPPTIELPSAAPLPNVLAVEMRTPARPFTPPPVEAPRVTVPELPAADAPRLAPAPAGPGLTPLKKTFTPPPTRTAALTTPVLPDAEAVGRLSGAAPAGPDLTPLKKTFTPPPTRTAALTTPVLPEAEAVGRLGGAAPAGPGLTPLKKTFTPPPTRTAALTTPVLPDAEAVGRLGGAAPAGPGLAPLKKTFTPPPTRTAALTTPVLPDAESVGRLGGAAPAGPGLTPLKKTFTPPPTRTAALTAPVLPEAEAVGRPGGAAPAGPGLAPLKKTFTPPPGRGDSPGTHPLPEADAVAGVQGAAPAGPNLGPLRKAFTSPPAPGAPSGAPPIPDLPEVSTAHLAIVSLDPSKTPVLPAPPPPRTAGFSAGPKPEPDGAATDGGSTGVVVPTVTVRDGPTRQTLLAAIRPMAPPVPAGPPPEGALPPTRVANAPDPMLEGRVVYTLAIQMPNVTSYSGSWIVWYAERRQSSGGKMRAPNPVRKVDPKYIAAAAAEGVQGVVRLGAVIRKDGHVEDVKLLRHLDDRLDRSAMESLAKWQFEPASRDGVPIDVDAVFEIPFRLAPKLSK